MDVLLKIKDFLNFILFLSINVDYLKHLIFYMWLWNDSSVLTFLWHWAGLRVNPKNRPEISLRPV